MLVVALASLVCASAAAAGPSLNIYDPAASPTWTWQINGNGASLDAATSVLADGSGAYVGGWAGNAAGNLDATLARISSSGAQKWLKRYDGAAHKADIIWKLAKGPGGTVYGVGSTMAANDKTNMLVIKWASNGTRKWARTYDGPSHGNDAAVALGVDKYGNVYVAGSSKSSHGLDYMVVKWSSNGVRKWVWRFDGRAHLDDLATDIRVESSGTCYVTGTVKTTGPKDAMYTVKLSASGSKVWAKANRGMNSLGAGATSIVGRSGGGVYVAGWSLDLLTGKDAFAVRYSSGGSLLNLPPYPVDLDGDDSLTDIVVTTNKRIVAVGSYTLTTHTNSLLMAWGSETTSPGALGFGGAFNDGFTAVAADSSSGVYYTGYERTAANLSQIRTARLSALDGSSGFQSVWGPALGLDTPASVAVSGTTAYVVGTTYKDAAEAYNQVILCYIY